MEKIPMLSDSEYDIMDCIWSSPEPPTQTDIMRWVNKKTGKNIKVATIATYNRRIMWKGYLEKRDGVNHHPTYHALISKEEYFERSAKEFCRRWGEKRVIEMALEVLDKEPERKEAFLRDLENLPLP